MTLRDRLLDLRDTLESEASVHGASDLRIFGSVARGEDRDDSDIDFLVSLEPGRTLLDLARLEICFEELLGRHVDITTENGLREPLRSVALREAVHV